MKWTNVLLAGFVILFVMIVVLLVSAKNKEYPAIPFNNHPTENQDIVLEVVAPESFILENCLGDTVTYYKEGGSYYVTPGAGGLPQKISQSDYFSSYSSMKTYFNPPTVQSCQAWKDKQKEDFVTACIKRGPPPIDWKPAPGSAWYSGTKAQCETYWQNLEKGISP